MRKSADATKAAYSKLSVDADVRAAVAGLNKATGKSYALAPSRGFLADEKRLKTLEDSVLSETIPLRREGGDSLYVSVVFNGKHTKELIVDSGSTLILLPAAVAKECGVEVGSTAPEIVLVLADGRPIRGRQVTIPSVRVGKFTLEDVDAAVLGPEAAAAEPLLGMSFLSEFKFEVDAQRSTLTMVKVEDSPRRR